MSIWIALWLILSTVLLVFLGWTLVILVRQKSAWKAFAKKHKLRYKPNAMMQAPEMDGVIEHYKMSFFSGEHVAYDVKGSRKLTAIEITLNSTLPVDGTIASGGMVAIAKALSFKAELRPDHKEWDKSYIAVTDNKYVLGAYLTPERLDILTRLMKVKNAWIMLIFRKNTLLLRMDLPDPLMTAAGIEKIRKMMITSAKILELKGGEGTRLKREEVRAASRNLSLYINDEGLDKASSALQLEEDHTEEKAAAGDVTEEQSRKDEPAGSDDSADKS